MRRFRFKKKMLRKESLERREMNSKLTHFQLPPTKNFLPIFLGIIEIAERKRVSKRERERERVVWCG